IGSARLVAFEQTYGFNPYYGLTLGNWEIVGSKIGELSERIESTETYFRPLSTGITEVTFEADDRVAKSEIFVYPAVILKNEAGKAGFSFDDMAYTSDRNQSDLFVESDPKHPLETRVAFYTDAYDVSGTFVVWDEPFNQLDNIAAN